MAYNDNLSIIVYSCKKNSDMWSVFGTLFRKYWPECNYRLLLVTDYDFELRSVFFDEVLCVEGTWYEMISSAIRRLKTKYVMLMMDDYLLRDYIDDAVIERCIHDANEYNAANIRLVNSDIRLNKQTFFVDKLYDIYTPGTAYSISTQIGIWDSELLLSYMRFEWSAWDFERKGSLLIVDDKHPLLGTREYVFPYVEGVRRGKWMKEGIKVCTENGIIPDFRVRHQMSNWYEHIIKLKTMVYNINPTLVQRAYNMLH